MTILLSRLLTRRWYGVHSFIFIFLLLRSFFHSILPLTQILTCSFSSSVFFSFISFLIACFFFARRVCFVRMHWNRTVEAPILDKGIYPGTQSANAEKSSNKKSNRLYLNWSDEWPGIKQIVNVLCIPTGFALVNYTVCNVCVSARKIIDRMYAWMLSTRN